MIIEIEMNLLIEFSYNPLISNVTKPKNVTNKGVTNFRAVLYIKP